MARWITVRKRFDFHWPGGGAITHFSEAELGEHFVKDDLADFAIERGCATEGKADASARSRKGTGKVRSGRAKAGKTADIGAVPAVDHARDADADRTADRPSVDPDAE